MFFKHNMICLFIGDLTFVKKSIVVKTKPDLDSITIIQQAGSYGIPSFKYPVHCQQDWDSAADFWQVDEVCSDGSEIQGELMIISYLSYCTIRGTAMCAD